MVGIAWLKIQRFFLINANVTGTHSEPSKPNNFFAKTHAKYLTGRGSNIANLQQQCPSDASLKSNKNAGK